MDDSQKLTAPTTLTLGRAIAIQRGEGEPATPAEMARYDERKAKNAAPFGTPAGKRFIAGAVAQMRKFEASGYDQMRPRDQRLYADWTPARLIEHLEIVRPRSSGREFAPKRRHGNRRRAGSRSPSRRSEDDADHDLAGAAA